MKFEAGNIRTKVADGTDDEFTWLVDYLTFEEIQFRRHRGQTVTHKSTFSLYRPTDATFATGLLPVVRRAIQARGSEVTIEDARVRPCEPNWTVGIGYLYPHQMTAVEAACRRTRGIWHHTTAAGKGTTIVALTQVLPCRWLIVVPGKDLVHQQAARFTKFAGEEAGIFGDSIKRSARVTVATHQTLSTGLARKDPKVLRLLREAEGLVIDEAHIAGSRSVFTIAMATPNAYWRIACSGTPLDRGDKRNILVMACTGEVIHKVGAKELAASGHVILPEVVMVPVSQAGPELKVQGARAHQAAYRSLITRSSSRNAAVVEFVRRAPKPCLVFVKMLEHGQRLTDQIKRAGLRAEFVWGEKSTLARNDVVRRLRDGDLDALVCNVIFQTGVDIPELEGLVNAAGGASTIAAIQRIGRGMRTSAGKNRLIVYDVLDMDAKRGGDRTCAEFMSKHAKKRMRDYEKAGYNIRIDEQLGATLALDRSKYASQ